MLELNAIELYALQDHFQEEGLCEAGAEWLSRLAIHIGPYKSCVTIRQMMRYTKKSRTRCYEYFRYSLKLKLINKSKSPSIGNHNCISIQIPNRFLTPKQQKENPCLTFYGKPVEEVITNYDSKIIKEIKLLDVYSEDGHIHFKEYWILKEVAIESESESESGKLCFKGLPYITKSAHFLIRPFKDQIQPLGVHA